MRSPVQSWVALLAIKKPVDVFNGLLLYKLSQCHERHTKTFAIGWLIAKNNHSVIGCGKIFLIL